MSGASSKIEFHYLVDPFTFKHRQKVKAFINRLLKKNHKRVEHINYIFCSDDYLLELNKTHLKHNTLTDIITFELSPKGEDLLADIYISIDRIRENASIFQSSFTRELHRVIFHGALHLCGYKDKSKQDAIMMRSLEEKWLDIYFVPRGTK
ncbi:MAG TPA: rRNA maturation RNase YbeY [Flavisolibacter sp.]|jgi:rRNA maturation RNase YbeY|nr:rRNA maturation RNase YbeY [Flavisolibacter sp.]